jgi:TM2 domain-containing membrane protein YozV
MISHPPDFPGATMNHFLSSFLACGLLVLAPDYRPLNAQDRGSVDSPVSICAAIFHAAADDSLANRHPTERLADNSDVLKNPELAGALSVLVPGLGQVYNGETVKGISVLTGFLGGIAVCIAAKIGDTNDSIGASGWLGVGMIGTAYLWGIIDAPLSANRINRENATRGMGPLIEIHAGAYSISLKTGITPHGISACVRLGVL